MSRINCHRGALSIFPLLFRDSARFQYGNSPIFPLALSNRLSTFHLQFTHPFLDSIHLHSSSRALHSLLGSSRARTQFGPQPALRFDTRLVHSPLRGYILRSSPHPSHHSFPAAPVLQIHLAHLMGSRHDGLGLRPPTLSMSKLSHAAHLSVHMTFSFHPVRFKCPS